MKNHSLHILLVDDVKIILQKMKMFLSIVPQVRQVDTANSAQEAFTFLQSSDPELVVLDVNMPGTNGIEILKRIRNSKGPQPVVVMLTNETGNHFKETCLQSGADYYLDKSRDFLQIPAIVGELIAKRA
ncbi:MAG: response regulator transcription factor [Bacteroidetes bacterium]|nr:response regulator transcription factor [Bacteroidota bacterium]